MVVTGRDPLNLQIVVDNQHAKIIGELLRNLSQDTVEAVTKSMQSQGWFLMKPSDVIATGISFANVIGSLLDSYTKLAPQTNAKTVIN